MSAIWSLVKKQHSHDERIAIMIDKAAGRLDISACKKNQIIASESIPIADLQAGENNHQGVGAAVNTFCQQHQLSSPTCTLMLPASRYQMLLYAAAGSVARRAIAPLELLRFRREVNMIYLKMSY